VCNIEYDVPQGNVLYSLLFAFYINSICDCKVENVVTAYADDTCLFFSDKSRKRALSKATVGLNNVYKSLYAKKLTLNKVKQCL